MSRDAWNKAVKQALEAEITPSQLAKRHKQLLNSKNEVVAMAALKEIYNVHGVNKASVVMSPMLVLTMPDGVQMVSGKMGDHGGLGVGSPLPTASQVSAPQRVLGSPQASSGAQLNTEQGARQGQPWGHVREVGEEEE